MYLNEWLGENSKLQENSKNITNKDELKEKTQAYNPGNVAEKDSLIFTAEKEKEINKSLAESKDFNDFNEKMLALETF